jgi:hypothetical protein
VLERAAVTAVVVAVVAALAWWWQRRDRRRPVPVPGRDGLPRQVHRRDLDDGTRPWLVALFSSRSCASCRAVEEAIAGLSDPEVAIRQVVYEDEPDLHARYRVPGVPLLLVADADGVVRAGWLGPLGRAELDALLCEARAGASPPQRG